MPQGLEHIKKTLTKISKGETVLDMLMEFERTLDGVELYAYPNWIDGELVKGPDVDRYWFSTTWMYPKKGMPDPEGALRLIKIGCKVFVEEDILEKPRRVLGPEDWENPKTKKAKLEKVPIYLVHIHMPLRYIEDKTEIIDDLMDTEVQDATDEVAELYQAPPEAEPLETEDIGAEPEEGAV